MREAPGMLDALIKSLTTWAGLLARSLGCFVSFERELLLARLVRCRKPVEEESTPVLS
jgi:hypothetical protein